MSSSRKSLFRAGMVVSGGILLGRLSGFLRDLSLAGQMGASTQADLAVLILTLPDILVSLLVAGAMEASLIPRFKSLKPSRAFGLYLKLIFATGLIFSVFAIALGAIATPIVHVFAPGFSGEVVTEAARFFTYVVWAIPLTAMHAVGRAYMHSRERFAMPALGALKYNLVVVVGILAFSPRFGLSAITGAVIAGAFVRLLLLLFAIRPPEDWRVQALSSVPLEANIFLRYFQALGAGSILMILPVASRAFSSFSADGSLSVFNYSLKAIELPLGVALSVFPVVIFPRLAELLNSEDGEREGLRLAQSGFRMIFLLSLTITFALGWMFYALAGMPLSFQKLSAAAVAEVGLLTSVGLLALPARGLSSLTVTLINARHDTKSPLVINACALLFYFPIAYLLQRHLGLIGLAWGLVAVYWGMLFAEMWVLSVRHRISLVPMLCGSSALKTFSMCALGTLPAFALERLVPTSTLLNRAGLSLLVWGGSLSSGILLIPENRDYFMRKLKRAA